MRIAHLLRPARSNVLNKSWWIAVGMVGSGCAATLPRGEGRAGALQAAAPDLRAPSFQPAIGLETMDRRDDRSPTSKRQWNEPVTTWRVSTIDRLVTVPPPAVPERPEEGEPLPTEPHFSFRWPEDERLQPEKEAPERFLDLYLKLLVGSDRQRVQRSIGYRSYSGNESLVAFPDREQPDIVRDREVTERRLDSRGRYLFMRPAEKSLVELDLHRDARRSIEGFKSEYLRRDGPNNGEEGHFTARLRRGQLDDTLEICYARSGWRVGSTGGSLRVSYDREVMRTLHLELGSRYRYGQDGHSISAGAHYALGPDTSLHLVGGNSFDSTAIPTVYGLTNPFEESSWGTGVYVELRF